MAKKYAMFPTTLAVEAACAVMRVNNGYVAVGIVGSDNRASNKSLLTEFIAQPDMITTEDREQAAGVLTYFKSLLWKNTLTGRRMSDFDNSCMNIANDDEVQENYLGQVAYMPVVFKRAQAKQTVEDRLYECEARYLGNPGDNILATIEILSKVYSRNYGCYFYSAITGDNLAVTFASQKGDFEINTGYKIKAKVKQQLDGFKTKINYVKIV